MSVFDAILNATGGLINATVEGTINVLSAAAAVDVGTIAVVIAILYVGNKVLNKKK